MLKQIETTFAKTIAGNCIEKTSETQFEVFDNEIEPKRCYIKTEQNQEGQFSVLNPNVNDIYFLAIDKCLLFDFDVTHCDFAVFDQNTFCFIELSISNKRNRSEKRKHAVGQLSSTISHFISSGISFENYSLEAIISFKAEKIYPARSAKSNDAIFFFESEFNAQLLEGNRKVFD